MIRLFNLLLNLVGFYWLIFYLDRLFDGLFFILCVWPLLLLLFLQSNLLLLMEILSFISLSLLIFSWLLFSLLNTVIFLSNLFFYLLLLLLRNLLSCYFGLKTVLYRILIILSWLICIFHLQTTFLNPIKDRANHRFWIKSMNFLDNITLTVVYSGVGKWSTSNILLTMLGIPHAIKVIYIKTPLFLMLQFVHYNLQVPAIPAIRWKILHKFVWWFVLEHQCYELFITN